MKISYLLAFGVVIGIHSQTNFAGSITDTFATGDTLTATHLNNAKAAVNDNDSRVTTNAADIAINTSGVSTNTTNIQNNATNIGLNAAGILTNASGISANSFNIGINTADIATNTANVANKLDLAGGTLTGGLTVPDINFSTPLSYTEALGMNDFGCYSTGSSTYDCSRVIIDAGRIAYAALTAGSTVLLTARLHIPDGARLTEVTCHFVDNSVSYNGTFRVLKRGLTSTGPGWLVLTNPISTTAASTSIQSLNATSDPTVYWGANGPIANNANDVLFVSVLLADTDGSGVIGDMFLNGCSYQYEVSDL